MEGSLFGVLTEAGLAGFLKIVLGRFLAPLPLKGDDRDGHVIGGYVMKGDVMKGHMMSDQFPLSIGSVAVVLSTLWLLQALFEDYAWHKTQAGEEEQEEALEWGSGV